MDKAVKNTNSYISSIILNNTQNKITLSIEQQSIIQTHLNGRQCPHCKSSHVVSIGNYKNRKRYHCKACNKYYNDMTKTPFGGLHKLNKVKKYIECMINGYSIRKSASIVGISVTTSFKWRHRLLDKIKKLPSPKMKDAIELEEIKLPFSAKGQRKTASKQQIKSSVSLVFASDRKGILDSDCNYYSHRISNPLFTRLKTQTTSNSQFFHSSKTVFAAIDYISNNHNIAQENNYIKYEIMKWNCWFQRFHGVATKYLSNYLHWFNLLENCISKPNKVDSFTNVLLHHNIIS
jgi:transposase-like protein